MVLHGGGQRNGAVRKPLKRAPANAGRTAPRTKRKPKRKRGIAAWGGGGGLTVGTGVAPTAWNRAVKAPRG